MQQFSFLTWKVYSDSQRLFKEIVGIGEHLPQKWGFEVRSQLIRSSLSIILNIAEGSGKQSKRELNRFLEIALGSAYETLACLDMLKRNSILEEHKFILLRDTISEICKQIGGLKKSIK